MNTIVGCGDEIHCFGTCTGNGCKVMHYMQRFIKNFGHPSILHGVCRNVVGEQSNSRTIGPVVFFGAVSTHEWPKDKFGFSIAIGVGKADAVNGGFFCDGEHRPRFIKIFATLKPLKCAT